MKGGYCSIIMMILLLLATLQGGEARGEDEGIVPEAEIGRVAVVPRGAVKEIYRRVDRLVPELRRLPSEKIVLLECLYRRRSDRDEQISRAFGLAAQVEKYLREYHKLRLDLWLAAHPETDPAGEGATLVFSVLSDSYLDFDRTTPELVEFRNDLRTPSGDMP